MSERRKMTRAEFEAQFFAGSRRIAPGIWIDAEGHAHYSVPELLALFAFEDTPENREAVARTVEETLRALASATATIIRIDPK
jgi:hypothetical protein